MASPPCRVAFFSLPAQRKEPVVWSAPHHCERAALPLRRPRSTGCGTGGARTRCAQTACPFFPVPHPAARLSAKGLFSSPETRQASNHPPGGASLPTRDGAFRGELIVPTPQSQSGCGNAGKAPEGTTIARSIPMGSCVLCRSPALRAILAPPAPQHHCPPGRLPSSSIPSPNQAHCSGAHGAPYPRTRVTGCCGVGCAARTNAPPPGKRKRGARATPCPQHPYRMQLLSC